MKKNESVVWPIRMKKTLIEKFKEVSKKKNLGSSEVIRALMSKFIEEEEKNGNKNM